MSLIYTYCSEFYSLPVILISDVFSLMQIIVIKLIDPSDIYEDEDVCLVCVSNLLHGIKCKSSE